MTYSWAARVAQREVAEALSLGTLKAKVDGVLSNVSWLKMSLLTAEGLDLDDL